MRLSALSWRGHDTPFRNHHRCRNICGLTCAAGSLVCRYRGTSHGHCLYPGVRTIDDDLSDRFFLLDGDTRGQTQKAGPKPSGWAIATHSAFGVRISGKGQAVSPSLRSSAGGITYSHI